MPKLASCPFCGCTTVRQFHPFEQRGYVIDCNQCNGGFHNIPEDQAVERWNTRKSDDGWRTMESAPKDGRYIIVGRFGPDQELKWVKHSRWITAREIASDEGGEPDEYEDAWTDGEDEFEPCYPTHWRPLPSPPEG